MRFRDYAKQRDMNESINYYKRINEADMPPPVPPALVRSIDQNIDSSAFRDAMADAKSKFGNNMDKVLSYMTAWQPSESEAPGFVRSLKAAAKKYDVQLPPLPSYLAKHDRFDRDDNDRGSRSLQINFPGKEKGRNLGLAAYHNYKTGNPYFDSAFQSALEKYDGNVRDAVTKELANWQPSEMEKDAFVSSLKQVARKAGLGDVRLAHHLSR